MDAKERQVSSTTYLLKVRWALSGLRVYKVTTSDLYHSVGMIMLKSIEKIDDIRYSEWLQEREDFWIKEGYTINSWKEIEV